MTPSHSMARSKNWERWEKLSLFVFILAFVALATHRIHSPGLYTDEMLFVPAATGARAYRSLFGMPLMIYPVIGALKTWIYMPIFALFGVSAASIRIPTILISCGTLVLGYALVRRKLSKGWAMAFTAACLVHPGFVFQAKVDWGPVVLMLFFKALTLYLMVRWLERPRLFSWFLVGMIAACSLGVFDKLNFVWFVLALSGATFLVYWKEIHTKLEETEMGFVIPITIAFAVVGTFIVWVVLPLMQAPQMNWQWLWSRLATSWGRYEETSAGLATAQMWFQRPPKVPLWPGWAVLPAAAGFLLLALPSYRGGPSARQGLPSDALRFCAWCLLMFAGIFVQIVITPQAKGPHHMLMLFPLDLLACFAAAFVFVNSISPDKRRIATLLLVITLLVWSAFQMQTLHSYFRRFRNPGSFTGRWSPRIEQLALYLDKEGRDVNRIYIVDWGIGFQVAALCQPDVAGKVRHIWDVVRKWSVEKSNAEAVIRAFFSAKQKTLYVTFTRKNSVVLEARQHFLQMNALAGHPARRVGNLPFELGEVYEIFVSGMDESEQRGPGDREHGGNPASRSD